MLSFRSDRVPRRVTTAFAAKKALAMASMPWSGLVNVLCSLLPLAALGPLPFIIALAAFEVVYVYVDAGRLALRALELLFAPFSAGNLTQLFFGEL